MRGAALLLVAGASAGCSSDTMRFNSALFADNTASQRQYSQPAGNQVYPDDYAGQPDYVDQTSTGSISRQAVGDPIMVEGPARQAGPAIPVPRADVGIANQAVASPYPAANAANQPFPGDLPQQRTARVTRQPLPAPSENSGGIDRTVTGSIQRQPQAIAPSQTASANSKSADASPARVPVPTEAPAQRVAVLPQPARLNERQEKPEGKTARLATTGAVYTVVSGDTLSGIARKTGSSTTAIKQANGLDSGLIRIGQKLVIPGANAGAKIASAKAPEGVDPITTGGVTSQPKAGYTAPKAEMEKMVERTATAPDGTGVGRLRWPVRGRIVSDFGSQSGGKRNDGIDIAVPEGTPVKAAENGVVIYAGDGLKDFGNTVLVRHENGLVTVYGHNSDITVSRGATVRRGQEIAKSGVSGNAGSPKLHFEVRKESTPVDPAKYLE